VGDLERPHWAESTPSEAVKRGGQQTWMSRDLLLVSLGAGALLQNCTCCSGICLQPATGDVALAIGMKLALGKCSPLPRTCLVTIEGLRARAYELGVNPEDKEVEPLGPTVTDTEGQVADPSTAGPAMALASAHSIAEYGVEVGLSTEHPLEVLDLRAAFWQEVLALSGTLLHTAIGDLHGPAGNGRPKPSFLEPLPKLVLLQLPIAVTFAEMHGGMKLCEASCMDVWSCIQNGSYTLMDPGL